MFVLYQYDLLCCPVMLCDHIIMKYYVRILLCLCVGWFLLFIFYHSLCIFVWSALLIGIADFFGLSFLLLWSYVIVMYVTNKLCKCDDLDAYILAVEFDVTDIDLYGVMCLFCLNIVWMFLRVVIFFVSLLILSFQ